MAPHGKTPSQGEGVNPVQEPGTFHLSELMLARRNEILGDWEHAVRELRPARNLSHPVLMDHIPDLLTQIAEMADQLATGQTPALPPQTAENHAYARLEVGYDLSEIVAEYAVLRDTILQHIVAQQPAALQEEVRVVHKAIDRAVAASVERYTQARERTLTGLNHIATASFESRSLEELLERLLRVFIETTPAADTAVILLREGNRLRMRASAGLEEELEQDFSLAIGEGFAGRIAAERRPLQLRLAATDAQVKSPIIHQRGVRALYGAPLIERGELVGVAHMGSLTAYEFSQEDQRLFEVLTRRATSAIAYHLLLQQLEQKNALLTTVVDQLPAGVILAEAPSGRLLLGNEQVAKIWRHPFIPSGSIEQYRAWTGAHPEDGRPLQPEEWALSRAILEGEIVLDQEVRILRGDGTWGVILSNAAPVRDAEGHVTAAIVAFVDVTELREALEARDDVLAVVSHDLRSPLGAILLNASTLLRSADAGEAGARLRRKCGLIVRSAERMTRLIDDLVDLASIRSRRLSITLRAESVLGLVQEAVLGFEAAAEERKIHLESRLGQGEGGPEAVRVTVTCDRDRILQVFSNLIGNALQVTPPGGRITLHADALPDEVVFSITDTGPGVATEELPHLFKRYWRSDKASYKGHGLGLAIAQGIVEAHGGRIWAESQPGQGSTFLFTLPRAPAEPAAT